MNLIYLYLVFELFAGCVLCQLDTYKAAVVEYAPRRTGYTPLDNLFANKREFENYIQQAATQRAQIIIFPEHGLTGWEIDLNALDQISTPVPDPSKNIAPCNGGNQFGNYSKFLVDLSCHIQVNNIYAVINVIEQDHDNYSKTKVYYNTNVVFDRKGVVIARYRKINLYDETVYQPGPHTATIFRTDFDVTFGMFISSDILFKTPSVDVLEDESITDVIFSSAWFSELPFFEALSIQHGYAKSNGVNLLASGLSDPGIGSGGSGIYLNDGRIPEMYISAAKKSKLIIQQVPKMRLRRNLLNGCQGASGPSRSNVPFGHFSDMNVFHTVESNLDLYTVMPLNLDARHISETICSADSNFCCTFNITVSRNSATVPNYLYKLVAFYGVSQVLSLSRTLGQRNCALVACLNDNINSCGGRNVHPPNGVAFENVAVRGFFDSYHSHQQPATLKHDLTPVTDYMYCVKSSGDFWDINMVTTRPQDSLLTFGIIDRIYDVDGDEEGLLSSSTTVLINVWMMLIAFLRIIY